MWEVGVKWEELRRVGEKEDEMMLMLLCSWNCVASAKR